MGKSSLWMEALRQLGLACLPCAAMGRPLRPINLVFSLDFGLLIKIELYIKHQNE
jgi:hypothetical protein